MDYKETGNNATGNNATGNTETTQNMGYGNPMAPGYIYQPVTQQLNTYQPRPMYQQPVQPQMQQRSVQPQIQQQSVQPQIQQQSVQSQIQQQPVQSQMQQQQVQPQVQQPQVQKEEAQPEQPQVTQGMSPVPPEVKEVSKKKKPSFWKKMLLTASLGIVFGLFAGSTILVFDMIGKYTGSETASENKQPVVKDNIVKDNIVKENNVINATTIVTDVTKVVEEAMPSVVSITNTFTQTGSFFGQTYSKETEGSGSGIIVSQNEEELLIVSNYHVVQDADSLKVQFINDDVVSAAFKGADSNMDLAVVAVKLEDLSDETKKAISVAKIGNSDSLTVGEPAIAIGNALGYGQSVSTGVISALDRQIAMEDNSVSGKLIQTDAAINPGNSGGALLNVNGEVVGINSSKIGGSFVEGMGYAIPISTAMPIIEELMLRETKNKVEQDKKGALGISGLSVTSDVSMLYGIPEGVFVTTVNNPDSGLQKSDVIIALDGISVGSMEDLQGYLEYYAAGETVSLTIMRVVDGVYEEMKVDAVLGRAGDFSRRAEGQRD